MPILRGRPLQMTPKDNVMGTPSSIESISYLIYHLPTSLRQFHPDLQSINVVLYSRTVYKLLILYQTEIKIKHHERLLSKTFSHFLSIARLLSYGFLTKMFLS